MSMKVTPERLVRTALTEAWITAVWPTCALASARVMVGGAAVCASAGASDSVKQSAVKSARIVRSPLPPGNADFRASCFQNPGRAGHACGQGTKQEHKRGAESREVVDTKNTRNSAGRLRAGWSGPGGCVAGS